MKLGKNQALDIDCIAKKGIGKVHSKWSPVSGLSMKREPIIKINPQLELELDNTQ